MGHFVGRRGQVAATVVIAVLGVLLTAGGLYLTVFALRAPTVMLDHAPPADRSSGVPAVLVPLISRLPARLAPGTALSLNAPKAPPRAAAAERRHGTWIDIPGLGVDLPVHDGVLGGPIPYWAALRYPGSSAPGDAGNSYLYAHGLWGMFGGLIWARVGDPVYIHDYDSGKVLTFHVSRVVGEVRWDDFRWIHAGSSRPMLTLQTCVDYDPHGDRWIVQAT